jgi:predicted transcriptional regulator
MAARPPRHSVSELDQFFDQMKPEILQEIRELEEIQAGLDEAERGNFASESEIAEVFEKYKPSSPFSSEI